VVTEPNGPVSDVMTVITVEFVEETDYEYTTTSVIDCAVNIPIRDVS
jgi:hypothetical protein